MKGRVTILKHLELFNFLAIGTSDGEILLYSVGHGKREPYQFFEFSGESITEIHHMPDYVADAKKHLLYLLTSHNCYIFQKARNFDEARLNKTDSVELNLKS